MAVDTFQEARLHGTPIRDLGLRIEGTPLEPVVDTFRREVSALGLRIEPQLYLSNEWGVPFGTVAIAIPFYLARPELTALHEERTGFVEGVDRRDILRYLRHELGHVVNYAYRLYERPEWVATFGPITRPYREEYRPKPFSRRHVRHLPGWYAQKHPDEDWAETFAVWMTPRLDWRAEYAGWPGALAKLELCDALLQQLRDEEPLVTARDLDEDVGEMRYTVQDFYGPPREEALAADLLPGLDGALCAIFEGPDSGDGGAMHAAAHPASRDDRAGERRPAAALVRRLLRSLPADVYRWTGHFPEHTRTLLRQMATRAEQLELLYPAAREEQRARELAVLVTALAMTHVQTGTYLP